MDHPTDGPVNPADPARPHPHDIAEPGPIDPATGQPDRHAEVSAVKSWFRQNLVSLVLTAAVVAVVCVYLDPVDTLKVVLGLGFIIFIHELGHFLAAKWCNVHVKTFSIGFGPAVPFCSYKWGETTYMLGIIPLGGYVSMVGEGTGENMPDYDPEEDTDPRSFKNKPVGQRLVIISAGVVMNVIFGLAAFVAAYLHGVQEPPAKAGAVVSGSAAWRAGIRTGDDIKKIGSRDDPTFKDLPPIVMSTRQGEQVPLVVERTEGGKTTRIEMDVEPLREEGAPFPQLGVSTQPKLVLDDARKRKNYRPVVPGTPAAAASNPAFEPGDRVVGMSDPAKYPDLDPTPLSGNYNEFHRRMVLLANKAVKIRVRRKGQPDDAAPTDVLVQPALRTDLGVRMRMGEVTAIRRGSAAEKAGVVARTDENSSTRGDRIIEVKLTGPAGKVTWFGADTAKAPAGAAAKVLDPLTLPLELDRWAGECLATGERLAPVEVIVLREVEHTDKRVGMLLDYDPSYRFDRETVTLPNTPLPLSGLGLAYRVEAVVDDVNPRAAGQGVQKGDTVVAVQLKSVDADGNEKVGDWVDIKPHQWASVDAAFQGHPPHSINLRVKRGDATHEVTLDGVPDPNWGLPERGLIFDIELRTQTAGDVWDAMRLGANRTVRFIKMVYMNLGGIVFGRISAKTMSGPLTIASVSYKIAGEDFWQFLLFLGAISVNLAVFNFLPIPMLDGGHAVFLILEKILGRPVPERLFAFAMYAGLFLILSLMLFVLYWDVRRVIFGWF